MNTATLAGAGAALVALAVLRPRHPARTRATGERVTRSAGGGASLEQLAGVLDGWARRVRSGESLAVVQAESGTGILDGDHAAIARHATELCRRLGGSNATVLEAAAASVRERLAAREEARTAASQARLSARILSVLPILVALWMLGDGRSRAALLSPAGLICALAGLTLNLCGWWWMRRLVRKAAS